MSYPSIPRYYGDYSRDSEPQQNYNDSGQTPYPNQGVHANESHQHTGATSSQGWRDGERQHQWRDTSSGYGNSGWSQNVQSHQPQGQSQPQYEAHQRNESNTAIRGTTPSLNSGVHDAMQASRQENYRPPTQNHGSHYPSSDNSKSQPNYHQPAQLPLPKPQPAHPNQSWGNNPNQSWRNSNEARDRRDLSGQTSASYPANHFQASQPDTRKSISPSLAQGSGSGSQAAVLAAAALAGAVSRQQINRQNSSTPNRPPSTTSSSAPIARTSSYQVMPSRTTSVTTPNALAYSGNQQTTVPSQYSSGSNQYNTVPSRPPSTTPSIVPSMNTNQRQNVSNSTPSYRSQPHQTVQQSSSTHSRQSPRTEQGKSNKTMSPQSSHAKPPSQANGSNPAQVPQQPDKQSGQQVYSLAALVNAADDMNRMPEPQPQEGDTSMLNFVDPSRVFNPFHREHEQRKRQEAEAAEKAKRETEAARQPVVPSAHDRSQAGKKLASAQQKSTPEAPQQAALAATVEAADDAVVDDESAMAHEMKLMMEKMKSFRKKDPSLFQKLMEDMRKGSAANNVVASAATVQSPSPQMTQSSPVTSNPAEPNTGPLAKPKNSSKADKIPPVAPANGYKVVIEDNPDGLPDLGRFPAERRIRGSYVKNSHIKAATPAEAGKEGETVPLEEVSIQMPESQIVTLQPSQQRKTVWPKDKRAAVTEVALRFLKAIPSNQALQMSKKEMGNLLDRNPPYADLCTMLEVRGFKFHRTLFAKELLNAVPGLQGSSNKDTVPVAPSHATPVPVSIAAHITPAMAIPLQFQPAVGVSVSDPISNTQLGYQQKEVPGLAKPGRPTASPEADRKLNTSKSTLKNKPGMGAKEAASRKRTLNELVDLTELSDTEDDGRLSKHPRLDGQGYTFEPFRGTAYRHAVATVPPLPGSFPSEIPSVLKFNPEVWSADKTQPTPGRHENYQRPADPVTYTKVKRNMAVDVDKALALTKEFYNPKTIARDVLIASGRHPTEVPLNLHLANMLGEHTELESDLSTFDWDEVDPGGPPVPSVEFRNIPVSKPRFKLGESIRRQGQRGDPVEKTRPLKPSREDRGVKTAHPDSHTHMSIEHGGPADWRPNVVRSSAAFRSSPHPSDRAKTSSRRVSVDLPGTSSLTSSQLRPPSRLTHNAASEVGTMDHGNSSPQLPNPRRRGRPPGSTNKHPSIAAMKSQDAAVSINIPSQQTSQLLGGETARPQKQTQSPHFHEYKCKWAQCKAILHNLETLRKHVAKAHHPTGETKRKTGYVCWWKKCKLLVFDDDGNASPSTIFDHAEEWLQHIEDNHIYPIALRYGDGPSTVHIDPLQVNSDRARYLSDDCGRNTTPEISYTRNFELSPDALTLTQVYVGGPKNEKEKADVAAHAAFLKVHRVGKDSRKSAEEVIRAMAVRKGKLGPGIDKGGCTLMNDERRLTFLQNPGIQRVVNYEY